jgi:hypothetical protein
MRGYEKGLAYETGIALTTEPCMFTNFEDKSSYRGMMSCGHTVDPNNLFSYMVYSALEGKASVNCPHIDPKDPNKICDAAWKYDELRKMALLNDEEKDFFEVKLSENKIYSLKSVKECRKCNNFIRKLEYTDKLICQSCLAQGVKPDIYCFTCDQEWSNRRKNDCENEACGQSEPFYLENMPFKEIGGVKVEAIQQCPNCRTVIEHIGTKYCKVMRCPCGFKFCFVCRKGDKEVNFVKCSLINGGCDH